MESTATSTSLHNWHPYRAAYTQFDTSDDLPIKQRNAEKCSDTWRVRQFDTSDDLPTHDDLPTQVIKQRNAVTHEAITNAPRQWPGAHCYSNGQVRPVPLRRHSLLHRSLSSGKLQLTALPATCNSLSIIIIQLANLVATGQPPTNQEPTIKTSVHMASRQRVGMLNV